jgi:hypothetical protein
VGQARDLAQLAFHASGTSTSTVLSLRNVGSGPPSCVHLIEYGI